MTSISSILFQISSVCKLSTLFCLSLTGRAIFLGANYGLAFFYIENTSLRFFLMRLLYCVYFGNPRLQTIQIYQFDARSTPSPTVQYQQPEPEVASAEDTSRRGAFEDVADSPPLRIFRLGKSLLFGGTDPQRDSRWRKGGNAEETSRKKKRE